MISEVGSGAAAAGSGTAVSITHGLTILSGDVVIAMITSNNSGVTIADNNGANSFTQTIREDQQGSGSSATYGIFSRLAGGSEPASYAFTLGASVAWAIQIRAFRSVHADIFEVTPSTGTRTGSPSDSTSATSADITTTNADSLGIIMAMSDAATGLTFSGPTNGYGNELEQGGGVWPVTSYTKQIPGTGSVGTVGLTLGASNDWTVQHFALKAEPTASTITVPGYYM